MTALPAIALDNEDVLRHLRDNPGVTSPTGIGMMLGRDKSNTHRSLARLVETGLLDADKTLTDAGHRALAALDVYAGRVSVGDTIPLLHHQIARDPDNARTASGLDEESIAQVAETLAPPHGRQLQPIKVRRPAVEGGPWVLVYGERRWRAVGLLIAQGRWPADKPLNALVAAGDETEADTDVQALVENLQRADLDNLEAGEAFLRVEAKHGLTPARIAAKVGKELRLVQIAMKTAREASAADKQAYRDSEAAHAATGAKRTFTWTRLRESVQDRAERPALELSPHQAVALGEAALLALDSDAARAPFAPFARDRPDAHVHALVGRGLVRFEFREGIKGVAFPDWPAIAPWLAQVGFNDNPARAVEQLQAAVVGDMMAAQMRRDGLFCTIAFNQPDPPPALPEAGYREFEVDGAGREVETPASRARGEAFAAAVEALTPEQASALAAAGATPPPEETVEAGGAAPPVVAPAHRPGLTGDALSQQIREANAEAAQASASPSLPPMQRLILLEAQHAIVQAGRGVETRMGVWTDKAAQALIDAGLLALLPEGLFVTPKGGDAIAALGIVGDVTPADLDAARRAAHWPREDGALYATAWLNPAPPELEDDAEPADTASAGEALAWLAQNPACELSYGQDEPDEGFWQVHRVNGGVNDREWTRIATGETPLAALLAARAASQGES